jgi:hypothetical protein
MSFALGLSSSRRYRDHYLRGERRDKTLTEKEQLQQDLANAFDRIHWEQIWRHILTAAIIVQFAIIGWLTEFLLHRI